MKTFAPLLLTTVIFSGNTFAANNTGQRLMMDQFVDGCRFAAAQANGGHVDWTEERVQQSFLCVTAIKPAMQIAIDSRGFTFGTNQVLCTGFRKPGRGCSAHCHFSGRESSADLLSG